MNSPFSVKFNWDDFDNTSKLTSFQKYRIKKRCEGMVKEAIQRAIDQSVKDRSDRRLELDEHKDPKHPFELDIGGEG